MTQIELLNIAQTFSGSPVLRDISLSIDSGDYIVLLGKSGCGKTTLLRIIAGLLQPDRGEVRFDGRSAAGVDPRYRDISLVSQQDSLYPHRTVLQSMRLPLDGKFKTDDVDRRIRNAIDLTGIEQILDRYPDRLSGGELRRASIAKAVARAGSLRLLDEPLSALDVSVRHSLQDILLRWHREVPGTTLHVTHDGQEAIRMADKIAVIENGKIVQCATPDQIYRQPETIAVAESIGSPSINLLRGSIRDGFVQIDAPEFNLGVRKSADAADCEVWIGIRPESFTIATSSDNNSLVAQVQRIDRFQGRLHIAAIVGDAIIHAITDVSAIENGEKIRLCCSPEKWLLFESGNGKRIR